MENKLEKCLQKKQFDKVVKILYKEFPKIKAVLLQMGSTEEDAHDIFQEALMIFYDKVQNEKLELKVKLTTYLTGICKILFLEKMRKDKKYTAHLKAIPAELENDVNEHHELEKKYALMEKVLNSLGPKCQEILKLFYYDQLKHEEIKEILGYESTDVVKAMKYKCLIKARKLVLNKK